MKKIISVMLAVCLVFAAFTLPITTVSAAESNTEAEGVGAESAFLHKTGQFSAITAKSFLSVIGPGYSESNTLANHDPKLMYDDMNYPAVYIELGLGNPEHGIGFSKNVRLEQNKTVKFELDLKDMPDLPNGANYTDFTSFASVPIALEQPTTFTFELSDYRFVLPNKEIPFDNCNGLHTLSFIDGEGFIGGNAGLNMTTAELKKGKLMANITLKSIEGLSKAEFYTMNAFAPLPNAEWFEFLKSEGFNSIRFQVTWYNHTNDKTYVIDKEWLNEVEKYLNMALNAGLYCSINVNWDMRTDYKPGDMMLTEEEITALPRKSGWLTLDGDLKVEERFAEVWRQIAEHFKDYDEYLIFESMNEPNAPDYTMQELGAKGNPEGHGWDDIGKAGENLNRLNQIFVDTVRKTGGNNAKRFLFVPPFFHKGAEPSLKEFKLPTDEADHTIVCVNRYLGDEEIGGGDIYPAVDKYLLKNGVGVVITEFGSFADDYSYDERLAFSQEETQKARKSGIPIFWYGSEWGKFDDPDAPNTCLYNPYTFEPVFPELIDVLMDSSANVARAVSSPQPTSSPKPTSPSVSSSNAVEKKFNTDANNFIKNADKAITWNRKSLGDIEFIEAFLDNDDNKPLIFCLHGGGGSKEQMMGELDRYAHEGFYAVALDAAGCGDSQVGPLMAYKSFEATVGYIDSLIDYYKNVTQADIDNFAVSGASMGGSIAFCYAAHGKYKPKVIFPKSGTPDLLLNSDGPMFDCFDRGQAGQPQTMTEEELKAFAAEYSPINTPEHFLEVAIYAINGEKDDITPPTGCKNLESALKKLGHEDISFNYFRNAGHGDDMNDNDAGIKFLMQHVGLDV